MFQFLGRGRSKKGDTHAVAASPPAKAPTAPAAQPSATQREMVRLTLHNVLRYNGIPNNWIACETVPVQLPNQGQALLLQMVVLQWHDALMHYAVALQQSILDGLNKFDPQSSASKYLFSWKFAPECGCPYTMLPEPSFWLTQTEPPSTSKPTQSPTPSIVSPLPILATTTMPAAPAKPKFDLPVTAADRGRSEDDDDHGFAATQLNEI